MTAAPGGTAVATPRAAEPQPRAASRARAWIVGHPTVAAALVYAVLSIVFVGQGLLPGRTLTNTDMLWSSAPWTAHPPPGVRYGGANFELADTTAVFLPFFSYARHVVPHAPLWNPYVMAGRPFLADGQSAVFSPFTVPFYVLPFWKSFAVMAMLRLFVAALGTYLLGRALGMRFGGALLAGVVFAFGTFFVVWLSWPLTNVFAILPWLLLAAERVVRRPGAGSIAGLAAAVALAVFGGHPESTFHAMVVTIIFFAFRLVQATLARRRRIPPRTVLAFAAGASLGVAVSAVALLPLLELLVHSGDYADRLRMAPSHSSARYLGAFFLSDYWGRPTQTSLVGDLVSNRGYYAGGITLMLAACALVLRPKAMRVAVAVMGVLTLAVVLGVDPIFSAITRLPGFRTAHNGRLVIVVLLCLALLAGWGLDDVVARVSASPRRRTIALGLAAAIFVTPVLWMAAAGTLAFGRLGSALKVAWGFADPPAPPRGLGLPPASTAEIVRMSALLEWLPLAGAGLAIVFIALKRRRGMLGGLPAGALVAAAVLVLVADLFRANMGFNPAIPIAHADVPTTPAIRYLQSQVPNRFAVLGGDDPVNQPLQPDLSMRYGLYDARGYDYPVEKRFDHFWRTAAAPPNPFIEPTQRADATPRALRALSLLSVTDLLQYPHGAGPRVPGLKLVYQGADARVYRNPAALPRVFLVAGQRTVQGGEAALRAVTAPGFDGRRTLVTETALPGVPQGDAAPGGAGSASLVRYGAESVTVRADARRRSVLVLTDTAYPGWTATVDGHSAPVHRVDYLLRGVEVPPGRHVVRFAYDPASWRVGWILSLLSAIVLGALALVSARRRWRPA